MSLGTFINVIDKMLTNPTYLIRIYEQKLALNNLQWLICHKLPIPTIFIQAFKRSSVSMNQIWTVVVTPSLLIVECCCTSCTVP